MIFMHVSTIIAFQTTVVHMHPSKEMIYFRSNTCSPIYNIDYTQYNINNETIYSRMLN